MDVGRVAGQPAPIGRYLTAPLQAHLVVAYLAVLMIPSDLTCCADIPWTDVQVGSDVEASSGLSICVSPGET